MQRKMPARRPRTWWRSAGAVVLTAMLAAAWSPGQAADKRVPIERDDVVGVWIGLTTDETEMVRLELTAAGRGVLGFVLADLAPCVVLLKSWSFRRARIELQPAEEGDPCAHDRSFRGLVAGNTVELVMQGEGWERRAHLKRESDLEKRWVRLREAMIQSTAQLR